MTDTGQVPGDGLPENAGMVEQPSVPAHGVYTYLAETPAEDEDLLLPGSHGAWGNEVAPPAPEPVVEAVHEPGPHEVSGRDSQAVDLGAVRHPTPAPTPPVTPAAPTPPRRPLHLGPPIPDTSASPVRSLADRGPAGAPVRHAAPPAAGPEYLDVPQAYETAPRGAAPWGAQAPAATAAAAPADRRDPAAEAVVPADGPGGAAQAAVARLTARTGGPAPVAPYAADGGPLPQEPEAARSAQAADGGSAAAPGHAPEDAHDPTGGQVPEPAEGLGGALPLTVGQEPAGQAPLTVADGQVPEGGHVAQDAFVAEEAGEVAATGRSEDDAAWAAEAAGAADGAGQAQAAGAVLAPAPEAGNEGTYAEDAPAPAADAGEPAGAPEAGHVLEAGELPAVAPADPATGDGQTHGAGTVVQAAGAQQSETVTEPQAAAEVEAAAGPGAAETSADPEVPGAAPASAEATAVSSADPEVPGAAPASAEATAVSSADPAPEAGTAAADAVPAPAAAGDAVPAGGVAPPAGEGAVAVQPTHPAADAGHAVAQGPQLAQARSVDLAAQQAPAPEAQPPAANPQDAAPLPGAPEPHVVDPALRGANGAAAEAAPASADASTGPVQQNAAEGEATPEATAAEGEATPEATAPAPGAEPAAVPAGEPGPAPAAAPGTEPGEPLAALPADAPHPGDRTAADPQPAEPAAAPDEPSEPAAADPSGPAAVDSSGPAAVHPADPAAGAGAPAADAPAPGKPEAVTAGQAPGHPDPTASLPGDPGRTAPLPGGLPLQPEPGRTLGRFVPVEGSVPTTPHLAPTPPHPVTVPGQHQPADAPAVPAEPAAQQDGAREPVAAVPAPRGADTAPAAPGEEPEPVVEQRADDLDTQVAHQEESTAAVAEAPQSTGPAAPGYDEAEREAVLKVMRERRDIRNGFRSDPIPHEVLLRVLEAAHTAPSVGHSQPWDFVVIRSAETRQAMHELAMRQREAYAKSLPKGRAKQFKELKIEAILDTPVNIVVTADPTRGGRHTLGRHTQPQMAPYSSALAVENLWLAARAEGLGVGWVSFFDEREMVRVLGLPEHLEVVAYLCVGYVDEFPDEPELMQAGWSKRRPLSWVVHEETYGRRALPGEDPHDLLAETVAGIRPLDAKALGEAWERQKRMTKPAGALGMLEIISAQLSGLSRQCPPPIPEPAAVAIFAGDHGVHAQGVTPWPQEVTAQMVANFLGGGAVCNAFAGQVGAEVCVVDVGVVADLPATPGLLPRKVRAGTSDMTTGPAMTREEAKKAIEVGIETARDLVAAGNKALLTGEMGIANTTASAALIAVYTGADPAEVTGRGTGINDETLARKTEVVRRALELHRPDPADPIGVLAAIGGFEHAAMVGLLLGGASLRTPVILDGVSAGAAALVARAIAPEVLAACIAGHRSAEPGHVAALNKLGLRPLVDLDLRLGEGTGALLALPLVQSTARAMHEVATFDSAGVTEK
ncbi:nicotinate-nucleotide--dimethylbenzimidazole phosphoribosyltransferase [Streptomyces sp. NPDC046831]|uniref:nicotinate-nucleotide--dimethylbenzimidazole phosphoribosyltransferase n=1 Tax=Streptomyces sp. NPDC046831 TaxID=3154805 RepID=UPI0033C96D18